MGYIIFLFIMSFPVLLFSFYIWWLSGKELKQAKETGKIKNLLGWVIYDKESTPETFSRAVFLDKILNYVSLVIVFIISFIYVIVGFIFWVTVIYLFI